MENPIKQNGIKKSELKIKDIMTPTLKTSFKKINEYAGNIYTEEDHPYKLLGSYMRNVYTWSVKRFDIINFKQNLYSNIKQITNDSNEIPSVTIADSLLSGGDNLDFSKLDFFNLIDNGTNVNNIFRLDGKEPVKQYVLKVKGILDKIKNSISITSFENNINNDFILNPKKHGVITERNLFTKLYDVLNNNNYNFTTNYIDSLFKILNSKFDSSVNFRDSFNVIVKLDKFIGDDILKELLELEKFTTKANQSGREDDPTFGLQQNLPKFRNPTSLINFLCDNIYRANALSYNNYDYIRSVVFNEGDYNSKITYGFIHFANTLATLSYIVSYLTYCWEVQFGEKLVNLEVLKDPTGTPKVETKAPVKEVAPAMIKKSASKIQKYIGILGGDTGKGNLKRGMESQYVANMQVSIFVCIMLLNTKEKVEQYFQSSKKPIDDRFTKIVRNAYNLMEQGKADTFIIGQTVEQLDPKLNDGIFGFRTEELIRLYKLSVLANTEIPVEFKQVSTDSLALQFTDLERRSINYILTELLYGKTTASVLKPTTPITPNGDLKIRGGGLSQQPNP
jgi:hypothetical protein